MFMYSVELAEIHSNLIEWIKHVYIIHVGWIVVWETSFNYTITYIFGENVLKSSGTTSICM